MGISILIEPVSGGRFRAATGSPLSLEAEDATREGAKNRLIEMIEERVCSGAEVETVEVGLGANHPLAPFMGDMRDDPWFEPWQEAIREYRKQTDKAEGI